MKHPRFLHLLALVSLATFATAEVTPRLTQLNELLQKNPQDAAALGDRGHTFALLGMKEPALADLQRAAKLVPNDNPALQRIAWSYFNLQEYERALETWLQAAAVTSYERYSDHYSVALGYWGVGDGVKATAFYDKAVMQDETFGEWKTLVARTETWTWAEKQAVYRLFDAWRRGFVRKEEK